MWFSYRTTYFCLFRYNFQIAYQFETIAKLEKYINFDACTCSVGKADDERLTHLIKLAEFKVYYQSVLYLTMSHH